MEKTFSRASATETGLWRWRFGGAIIAESILPLDMLTQPWSRLRLPGVPKAQKKQPRRKTAGAEGARGAVEGPAPSRWLLSVRTMVLTTCGSV